VVEGALVMHDVAIVGGGPAGLALAVHAARRGLEVALFDRASLPADKACGEGIMPAGVRALEALGVCELLSPEDFAPFRGIHYLEEDGSAADALLPDGGGLGVRRTALSGALLRRALESGARIHERETVRSHRQTGKGVGLITDRGEHAARILVAADGLHSARRRSERLEARTPGRRRFGLRQHFHLPPWSDRVEIHFSGGAEAYVTPCGRERVGVAFLWEDGRVPHPIKFDAMLARFPALAARLEAASPESRPQGAGPLLRRARALTAHRFALLGDAAGYVDAITGEGVSLALRNAEVLAAVLPEAIARGGTRSSLLPYERHARAEFTRYARHTRAVLQLTRRPRIRHSTVRVLGRSPRALERIVALGLR
jgi:menaquinone-9 beta-reductase